jgi:hypothetical protein
VCTTTSWHLELSLTFQLILWKLRIDFHQEQHGNHMSIQTLLLWLDLIYLYKTHVSHNNLVLLLITKIQLGTLILSNSIQIISILLFACLLPKEPSSFGCSLLLENDFDFAKEQVWTMKNIFFQRFLQIRFLASKWFWNYHLTWLCSCSIGKDSC